MNYPDTQRTGRLAELKVEEVFTSWSWTVGQDHIDTGYDFFVQPDVREFRGHRFLVQVKATQRTKRGPVARVAKARLREYATNPLPVILVWSSSEGVLHWLHIQPWIRKNAGRLNGSGDAGIKLLARQTLDDRDAFTAYLAEILKPAAESETALSDLAQDRSRYLSSIDSRLGVRVGLRNGAQSYEIFAKSEPTVVGVEIELTAERENQEALVEAIRYGLPTSVDVSAFRMKGSDIFAAIGVRETRGIVSIQSARGRKGVVTLYPGSKYSMLAPTYPFAAQLYLGNGGFSVSNEDTESILDFKLRGDFNGHGKGNVNITMGLRSDQIGIVALQYLDDLGRLGDWASEVMNQGGIYIDLSFNKGRIPLNANVEALKATKPILRYLFVMGRLQKTARALNSELVVHKDFVLSNEDIADIHLAYGLLKGERLHINLEPVEFKADEVLDVGSTGNFYAETVIEFALADKRLGAIPVAIDLNRFTLEPMAGSLQYRLVKGEDGEAIMYYDDQSRTNARLARKKLPDGAL